MPQPQTELGAAGGDVAVPPTPPAPPAGGGGGSPEQMRRMLILGVLGFLALVLLLMVAFGSPDDDTPPADPSMPALTGMGLQIAQDKVKDDGNWGDVVVYDATGQDRSLRVRRDWQVCYQAPAAGPHVSDKGNTTMAIDTRDHRAAGEVWLGAVRTDESCAKLASDFGMINRVYNRTGPEIDLGKGNVPNLVDYPAHMARIAFGEDASIRVQRIRGKNEEKPSVADLIKEKVIGEKAIKTDASDEVGSGWEAWKVCNQTPAVGERWNGRVINLKVVRTNDNCAAPTKS